MTFRSWLAWWVLCLALPYACHTSSGADDGRSTQLCVDACWRIAAANCGDLGSECVDRCVREYVPPQVECAAARQRYLDCFWQTPGYTCDPELGTLPTDCDAQRATRNQCLGVDAALVDAAGDSSAAETTDAAGDR